MRMTLKSWTTTEPRVEVRARLCPTVATGWVGSSMDVDGTETPRFAGGIR